MKTAKLLARNAMAGIDGRYWYADAATEIRATAAALAIDPRELASLLALFSPRVQVRRSIDNALDYVKNAEFHHSVMRSTRAAVLHWENTGVIRGKKTEPFSRAVIGDGDAVVVDVWMCRAIGIDHKKLNKSAYAECVKRIRKAALLCDMTPAECQAAIWCNEVRKAGRRPYRLAVYARLNKTSDVPLFF